MIFQDSLRLEGNWTASILHFDVYKFDLNNWGRWKEIIPVAIKYFREINVGPWLRILKLWWINNNLQRMQRCNLFWLMWWKRRTESDDVKLNEIEWNWMKLNEIELGGSGNDAVNGHKKQWTIDVNGKERENKWMTSDGCRSLNLFSRDLIGIDGEFVSIYAN